MLPGVQFPDVPLWATGYLRVRLGARTEPYAANVAVGVTKPASGRSVVLDRDGGPSTRVRDFARMRVRVWADTRQEASDLARLVRSLLLASPGEGSVVAAGSSSGPSSVPDDGPQSQFIFSAELTFRGTNLT